MALEVINRYNMSLRLLFSQDLASIIADDLPRIHPRWLPRLLLNIIYCINRLVSEAIKSCIQNHPVALLKSNNTLSLSF